MDRLPRVDVPGDWVDFVVPSPKPYLIDPLFTRDPAKIRNENVLMAMMAIAAVYEPYQVRRLNHGIGYATAAIELILPTFAAQRGLKGKIARHFVLNPHPTLIPAIEAGFVDSVYCFGSELGMERYVSNRADIFPVGADGNLRSNRALAQVAGQYACDLFIGGTLQIDAQGNSSTATKGRITGFGGAPNMGADPRGRRHDSPTWLRAGQEAGESLRGRKLVVQMVQTHQPNGAPSFVERLDAFDLAASAGFALPPVMIYGDDVTHVITERGVANLLRCRSPQEREAALRAVAGDTDFGRRHSPEAGDSLRRRGIVVFPSDLGIDVKRDPRLARGQNHRRARDGFRRTLRAAGEIPPARRSPPRLNTGGNMTPPTRKPQVACPARNSRRSIARNNSQRHCCRSAARRPARRSRANCTTCCAPSTRTIGTASSAILRRNFSPTKRHCARRRSVISPPPRRKPRPRSHGPAIRPGRNCCGE